MLLEFLQVGRLFVLPTFYRSRLRRESLFASFNQPHSTTLSSRRGNVAGQKHSFPFNAFGNGGDRARQHSLPCTTLLMRVMQFAKNGAQVMTLADEWPLAAAS